MLTEARALLAEVEVVTAPILDGGVWRAGATVVVAADEPVLTGHFPGRPLLPGVCVIECADRAAMGAVPHRAGDLVLDEVLSARFTNPVYPGETLRLDIQWRRDGPAWLCVVRVGVGDVVAAVVRLRYLSGGAG